MLNRRYWLLLGLTFGTFSSLVCAAEFEPGEWQTEVRIEFNGSMFPVPFTTKKCLTKADPIPNTTANTENCSITDVTDKDNQVGWTLQCIDAKGSLHGVGSVTFEEKAFKGTMEMEIRDEQGKLINQHRYHMSGSYRRPCQ